MTIPPSNASDFPEPPSETLTLNQFAVHYRQLYPRLWLTAAGMTGDRTQADDIVQEAAIIALKKLDQFTAGTNLNAWLGEIVRRCALNYIRKMRNRATLATDPTNLDRTHSRGQSLAEPTNLADMLSGDQLSFDDDVMHALEAVGETARCCLLLRAVQQLSYAEIAELLGIPEGTAMSHVHRAKGRMRKSLKERFPPGGIPK